MVYELKNNVSRADFSDPFRKVIILYLCVRYSINEMLQSARLVVNTVTVNNFASLFNSTPDCRALD